MDKHKIRAQNLVKIYGKRAVVNDLSLEMSQVGWGILGLMGLVKPLLLYDHRFSKAQ